MDWRNSPAARTWIPHLNEAEIKYKVPKDLCARQCFEESGFNPKALNPKSRCIGLMQLLPADFPGAGKNPLKDIDDGVKYVAHLHGMFNDWQLALAAYDWGPGNIRKTLKKPGPWMPLLPPETRKYVTQIIGDVPVPGALCKTPSLPSSQPVGSLLSPSSAATLSVESSPSLWSRLSSPFIRKALTTTQSPLPLVLSVPLSPRILSQTENQGVHDMSNPVLTAAAPSIIAALNAVKQFSVDIGPDPAKWALLVPGATAKLLGTIEMQLPLVVSGEAGALQALVGSKVDELIAKINAAIAPPQAEPAPATPTQAV